MVCSNYWNLDKIDKIVISLIFIVVTMFTIFNCFCFASEYVDLTTNYNLVANLNTNTFEEVNLQSCVSFYAEKGYKYKISVVINQSTDRVVVSSSNEPAVGVSFDVLYNVLMNKGDYFIFTPSDDTYVSISRNIAQGTFQVEKIPLSGFENTIQKLTSNVGLSSLWSVFNISVPYVLIVVCVAFGIYLIVRIIKGLSKGKGRL